MEVNKDNITVIIACKKEEEFLRTSQHILNSEFKVRWQEGVAKIQKGPFSIMSALPSFSYLVNQCIINSETEALIFCSDKVTPKPEHVYKVIDYLNNGQAWAGLYRWAFCGFHKQLIREIGFLDEEFIGGGHEDGDFYIRCMEHNVAYTELEDETLDYKKGPSRWGRNMDHIDNYFKSKWGENIGTCYIRKRPEVPSNYPDGILGPWRDDISKQYLSWSHGKLMHPEKLQYKVFNQASN